jgi:hypothetical protein
VDIGEQQRVIVVEPEPIEYPDASPDPAPTETRLPAPERDPARATR